MKTRLTLYAAALIAAILLGATPGGAAPQGIRRVDDIVFYKHGSAEVAANLVRPDDDKIYPGAIVVHGGGFIGGDKTKGDILALSDWLAQNGYAVFNVNYRLMGAGGMFPKNVMDVKCGLRWFTAHAKEYGVDPDRIGAVGESAGGYLVSMLAVTAGNKDFLGDCPGGEGGSDRVDAVFSIYGVHDFTTMDNEASRAAEAMFFGSVKMPRDEFKRWISPISYADKAVPMFMIHGGLDELVPPDQSRSMCKTIMWSGGECSLVEYPDEEHGWFDLRDSDKNNLDARMRGLAFLDGHLKKKSRREAQAGNKPGDFKIDPNDYSFLTNVMDPSQFEAWRRAVVYFYRKTIRIKPAYEALPLNLKVMESEELPGGTVRSLIEYDTTDGLRIPAYLFVPKTNKPAPAIIVYHGHGPGKKMAATDEGNGSNENALAIYLAEKLGYVVLAPDARTFGEFRTPNQINHANYYMNLALKNQLYMARLMQDGYQDMALLKSLPEVDPDRIGAAGISMGSWRTLNHAVLHEDIRAAVVAGLFISWDWLFSGNHCGCQHITKLKTKMAMQDLAATIFPRKLMIQWGLDDRFYTNGGEETAAAAAEIAKRLGYEDSFIVDKHPGMGHQFSNPEVAEFFYREFGDGAIPFSGETPKPE